MKIIGTTATRIADHTDPAVNERIWLKSLERIEKMAHADRSAVFSRIAELDREWDMERVLAVYGGILGLAGLGVLTTRGRLGVALARFTFLFSLLHGVVGWCPPGSFLRRLGIRSEREIDDERAALIALLDS